MQGSERKISFVSRWAGWYGFVAIALVCLCFGAMLTGVATGATLRLAFLGTFFLNVAAFVFHMAPARFHKAGFAVAAVGIFFLTAAISEIATSLRWKWTFLSSLIS
jgi:hypothetical protein